ncbi:unnamed protein product [Victoria cruziana]
MSVTEVAIWAAMLGGLLTLAGLASVDLFFNIGALRNLVFLLTAGTAVVLLSGLPEQFWPGLNGAGFQIFKVGLGPLGGAIALYYLGLWLGGSREDPAVAYICRWGAGALVLAGLALGVLAAGTGPEDFRDLLLATALVSTAGAVLGLIAATRAAAHGDPLARWMVPVCIGLVLLVMGHYLHALKATGLPTGSVLLNEVEHAFWRTERLRGSSTVVCLHLHNLYELGQTAGHGVEHQILVAMAARIRRAAGFRCVVGLYHPACFVVVISSDGYGAFIQTTVQRLRALVSRPLTVTGRDQTQHRFKPALGVGLVTLDQPGLAVPLDVINEAERLALLTDPAGKPDAPPKPLAQDTVDTVW